MLHKRYTGSTLVLYFIYMFSRRATADIPPKEDTDHTIHFLEGFKPHQNDKPSLRDTISNLDDYLAKYQKRTCQFGLNSHHCRLSALDDYMSATGWLSSGFSPGKRSKPITDLRLIDEYSKIIDDIHQKREHLAVLKDLLEDAENHVTYKRKRSCRFNLGGRCATELASAIADQYYYLNGPHSPGKRRR